MKAGAKKQKEEVVTLPSGRKMTQVFGKPPHRERAERRSRQSFGLEPDKRKG